MERLNKLGLLTSWSGRRRPWSPSPDCARVLHHEASEALLRYWSAANLVTPFRFPGTHGRLRRI